MKYLRLKKRKDFTKIMREGKRAYSGALTVVYFPSDRLKMAVCVGKKHGKSVRRNRVKRLLREAFRAHAGRISSPASFLLIPKVSERYEYSVFVRDLGKILKKEGLADA